MLNITDLSVTFTLPRETVHALQSINWTLKAGEILGFVGESGSGKTVNALSVLRLLPPHATIISGKIEYQGNNILDFTKKQMQKFRSEETGFIFQEPSRSFDPICSIEKTFAETFRVQQPNMHMDDVREKTVSLLREVHIQHPEQRLHNIPAQFSGGMLQRVMIALALSRNPSILIADEPTTALDLTIEAEIINLLLTLQKQRNFSVLFISHNIALVLGISNRIAVMKDGKIVETADKKTIMHAPGHPYTKYLMDNLIKTKDIIERKQKHAYSTKHL